jgi:hypothetical protein
MGRIGMAVRVLALLGLLLLADAHASRARSNLTGEPGGTVQAGETELTYGTNNAEDTPVTFSCKTGQGTVRVFINETGRGVKPGRSMTASLTAGPTTSKIKGRTLVNEEAGSPSFAGTLPASDPLFAALAKAPLLVMVDRRAIRSRRARSGTRATGSGSRETLSAPPAPRHEGMKEARRQTLPGLQTAAQVGAGRRRDDANVVHTTARSVKILSCALQFRHH